MPNWTRVSGVGAASPADDLYYRRGAAVSRIIDRARAGRLRAARLQNPNTLVELPEDDLGPCGLSTRQAVRQMCAEYGDSEIQQSACRFHFEWIEDSLDVRQEAERAKRRGLPAVIVCVHRREGMRCFRTCSASRLSACACPETTRADQVGPHRALADPLSTESRVLVLITRHCSRVSANTS